jgi:NAD(P) transhydrogenase subunit beta
MSMNLVTLLYLVASVCFIQALKGLSHPTTSIRGNVFGMAGMLIAVLTTAALIVEMSAQMGQTRAQGMAWVLGGLVVGGAVGATMAKRVEMTKMPELVAFMHSMIGLAAVFIAVAAVVEPWAFGITIKGGWIPGGNRVELAASSPSASCRGSTSSACSRARRCSSRASTSSTRCSGWRRCFSSSATGTARAASISHS